MSITPRPSDWLPEGRKTWVNSQWKFLSLPGHFSVKLNTRGMLSSAVARVVGAERGGVTVELADKSSVRLEPGDRMLARLDLAYALNKHMAQGVTTDRAITVMSSSERQLSNQRLFNVGVTRVRDTLTLVVDNKAKLEW